MSSRWHADEELMAALVARCRAHGYRTVVDIGATPRCRFPAATVTVGWQSDYQIDLCSERLPFADSEVDFVFCRQTIEDLANPEWLLSEIRRVAKAGYIESPSPIVETSRRVDCTGSHMGFYHHRWIVYSENNTLTCLAKYPLIERLPVTDYGEKLLRGNSPAPWQTRHQWTGPLNYKVLQHERGVNLALVDDLGFSVDYMNQISHACAAFITRLNQEQT
jgi:hypothetical protein